MRIYVMDSSYEVMRRLELFINSRPKYEAICFTSPRQLLDKTQIEPPDIVFMDIDTTNGLTAVKTIQSINPEIKIIMMSESKENISECFKIHADGFLAKPMDEESIREQLYRVKYPLLARIKYGSERTTTE